MNIESCQDEGQPGYRAGKKGKCHIYMLGDQVTREVAYRMAVKEGKKIEAKEKKSNG